MENRYVTGTVVRADGSYVLTGTRIVDRMARNQGQLPVRITPTV
jgi:hypothetical protein